MRILRRRARQARVPSAQKYNRASSRAARLSRPASGSAAAPNSGRLPKDEKLLLGGALPCPPRPPQRREGGEAACNAA